MCSVTGPPPCSMRLSCAPVHVLPRAAYANMTEQEDQLLLVPQRIQYACEFVAAVEARRLQFGTHVSGPSGVGKSGILLLAYLMCAARGYLTAYIPQPEKWVELAGLNAEEGYAYMLSVIWRQNADLIVASPALRRVFRAALQNKIEEAPEKALRMLHDAKELPPVAVLIDDVQRITNVVRDAAQRPVAASYFIGNWYNWTANWRFPQLTAASAHSHRDTNLPAGQNGRLRVVEPLAEGDRAALQAMPGSPIYVADPLLRPFVVSMTGNILRDLAATATLLQTRRASNKADRALLWDSQQVRLENPCTMRFDSLPKDSRFAAGDMFMDIFRGRLHWGGLADNMYDDGIVYRTAKDTRLRPVSAAATAVLLKVMAAYINKAKMPLTSVPNTNLRWKLFERQGQAKLNVIDCTVRSKLISGHPSTPLHLRSDYGFPFDKLDDVSLNESPVFYWPTDSDFECDGVLMPSIDDPNGIIYVIDFSLTSPRSTTRVLKLGGWYKDSGFISRVRARFPGRTVISVQCFPHTLSKVSGVTPAAAALSNGSSPPPPRQHKTSNADTTRGSASTSAGSPQPQLQLQRGADTINGTEARVLLSQVGDCTRVLDFEIRCKDLGMETLAGLEATPDEEQPSEHTDTNAAAQ